MRHRVAGYKLGRDAEHRRAMWRNMAASLFTHGQITTTLPKAKSVKPFVERLITMAKKGDLASRRRVISKLQDRIIVRSVDDDDVSYNRDGEVVDGPRLVKKLFDEIAPKYMDRPGGYTRIVRLDQRRVGDGSDLVVLQLVGDEDGPNVKGRASRRRQTQDNRTAFAAKLRRGSAEDDSAEAEPEADEQATEAAVAEAETDTSEEVDTEEQAEVEEGDSEAGDKKAE